MKNLNDDFYKLSPAKQRQCHKLRHAIQTLIVKYDSEVSLGILPDFCCELFFIELDCNKETFLKAMSMSWDKLQGEYDKEK